jgi:hypothetical protein
VIENGAKAFNGMMRAGRVEEEKVASVGLGDEIE